MPLSFEPNNSIATRTFNHAQAPSNATFVTLISTNYKFAVWHVRIVNTTDSIQRVRLDYSNIAGTWYPIYIDTIPRNTTFTPITKNNPLFAPPNVYEASNNNGPYGLRFRCNTNGVTGIFITVVYDLII